ncbi:probable ubiquitin-like-specific protease 2B isoform X1 [Cynara cardunculus var. scolymus]|uniref:probable ubiquitin-like-specific protease 2B isoform X1 n=1 Tax=Cynara cardunculus var. scolymus TaxID=59895 RepID=UPI000D6238B7|nr:probable ubiquitin-like-specific protease 2B isoform X1 [Cynara cardunculus var. scolymus]
MSKVENSGDAVDQYTFLKTKQLPQSDSETLEPNTMLDSVDVVSVAEELTQSHPELRTDLSEPDVNAPPEAEVLEATVSASPRKSKLNSSELVEAVNVDPHEPRRLYQIPLSTCSSIAEDDGVFCQLSSDHCTGELEVDNEDLITVVLYPDHMVYCDSYCTDCVLTFTSSCIKIEGLTLDGDDKTFKSQWEVQDILHIKSHWYELVQMAIVSIHVLTGDTIQAENVECTSGTELKFAVIGTNWYGRQEAITCLNALYKSLWSSMLESEDTVYEYTQASFTKYFPNFDQPFEEIIYPKGDVDAVSVSKRDVDLLQPDTFVNDTIIDFYIKYLKNKIKPEERHRFHFFNSFFFRKLADLDKDPLDAFEGKEAFQRVRKWTRKVNLFQKDYVFIPVNYNYHWSLIVMCHLGEVATYKDEDVTKLIKVSCVLHMDSLRGTHTGLKDLMQSYLREEWKGRVKEASEDISSRFDNLRFISLELPQQPNSFDCGLFLLHYVELFLDQAPTNFNPFKITKSVNFLNEEWFPPADASLKRVVIQRLIYDLLEKPSHEASSMAANEEYCNLSSPTTSIRKGTAVNFFSETCNPSTDCQSPQVDHGVEISLLPSLSLTTEPCHMDASVSLKAAFEPGSFLAMNFPSFNETTFEGYKNSLVPPIEEDVETAYSPTEVDLELGNGITPEVPSSSRDCKSSESWQKNNNFKTWNPDSLEVINGNDQIDAELRINEIGDQPRSPLLEMVDDGDNADYLALSSRCSEMEANGSNGLEADLQHHTKRMRTVEPESRVEGDD